MRAAVLDLGADAERTEVHEVHATRGSQDLTGALEVFSCALAQDLGLDEIGERRHG
ncbi:MAG TPA: hypothetical protein VFP66_13080 [Candidatus Limnocylindrales bacterium]|nr:hypothetical protein [Candidatus Limnocylindrales bacterium]